MEDVKEKESLSVMNFFSTKKNVKVMGAALLIVLLAILGIGFTMTHQKKEVQKIHVVEEKVAQDNAGNYGALTIDDVSDVIVQKYADAAKNSVANVVAPQNPDVVQVKFESTYILNKKDSAPDTVEGGMELPEHKLCFVGNYIVESSGKGSILCFVQYENIKNENEILNPDQVGKIVRIDGSTEDDFEQYYDLTEVTANESLVIPEQEAVFEFAPNQENRIPNLKLTIQGLGEKTGIYVQVDPLNIEIGLGYGEQYSTDTELTYSSHPDGELLYNAVLQKGYGDVLIEYTSNGAYDPAAGGSHLFVKYHSVENSIEISSGGIYSLLAGNYVCVSDNYINSENMVKDAGELSKEFLNKTKKFGLEDLNTELISNGEIADENTTEYTGMYFVSKNSTQNTSDSNQKYGNAIVLIEYYPSTSGNGNVYAYITYYNIEKYDDDNYTIDRGYDFSIREIKYGYSSDKEIVEYYLADGKNKVTRIE